METIYTLYKSATVFLILCSFPAMSLAVPFGFENITNNTPGNAAIGETQLWVDVLDHAPGQVSFVFHNNGPQPCSITDVYFDDDALLAFSSIMNSPGVAFSQLANPSNLPGGNMATPPFQTGSGLSADSDPPAQPNGVNPGEQLVVIFSLIGTHVHNDVLNDLYSRDLRVGIHVQGFGDGGSESFIHGTDRTTMPVPEPSTMFLLGSGMIGAAILRRRLVK